MTLNWHATRHNAFSTNNAGSYEVAVVPMMGDVWYATYRERGCPDLDLAIGVSHEEAVAACAAHNEANR